MTRYIGFMAGIFACLGIAASSAAAEPAPQPVPELEWHTDYGEAMNDALRQQKMLFIFFHQAEQTPTRRSYEEGVLRDARIVDQLRNYVVATLPLDAKVRSQGVEQVVLEHPAFQQMRRQQGIAVVDEAHPKEPFYGRVVSAFPFTSGKVYTTASTAIILGLPAGTITQRTMIFAVRRHPENPASTQGTASPLLLQEASSHSDHQANILLQGHHSWDSRFQRIGAQLPGGLTAQEVVAESWPNEDLVEACIDCVDSWRQSPGHWSAVRERHPLFGFDIKLGRNGIWYATGIFGRHGSW
jgi:hypothetical protein